MDPVVTAWTVTARVVRARSVRARAVKVRAPTAATAQTKTRRAGHNGRPMETTRGLMQGIIDFAGLFPPASLDMPKTLAAYAKIGFDNRYATGERYTPAWLRDPPQAEPPFWWPSWLKEARP